MKVQMKGGKLLSFSLIKLICFYLLVLVGTTSSQKAGCPFDYLYHFGDGITDTGNSIHVLPNASIPASRRPYGDSLSPPKSTGRWSDGLVDFDYTAEDFGLPEIVPYLTMNHSEAANYHGVIFSVARSPVLDRKFFKDRKISIPDFAVPLRRQMRWFKKHLLSICSTRADCMDWIENSLVLMGDIEGNDIAYALTQGKTIQEVKTYVPSIIKAIIDSTRELVILGATRVIIPGNGPLGCVPYILTALQTDDPTSYDELGCLKSVNDLIIYKNNYLQQEIANLKSDYSDVHILYGPMYDGVTDLIRGASIIGPLGNSALRSCCGIGGKYNYDSKRFCGDPGVRICCNPEDFIFWDGIHFTQQTHWEIEDMLVRPALVELNCSPLTDPYVRSNMPKRPWAKMTKYLSSQ